MPVPLARGREHLPMLAANGQTYTLVPIAVDMNIYSVYYKLHQEHHIGLEEFLDERFGIRGLFQP